jgi:WD40 repeat protein
MKPLWFVAGWLVLLMAAGYSCFAQGVKERASLTGHTSAVGCVVFSPDGKTLATASADKTVKVWDSRAGEVKHTLRGHVGQVSSVAFSPDGKTLASGGWDSTIRLWDVQKGKLKKTLHNDPKNKTPVQAVVFSPDGRALASGDWGSGAPAKLWDLKTGRFKALAEHDAKAASLAFSPDGKRLVVGGDGPGVMSLWDVEAGKLLWRMNRHRHIVTSVKFSPDGRTIVSGSRDRTVGFWAADTGKMKRLLTVGKDVESVALSPDGKTLAVGSDGRVIRLLEPQTTASKLAVISVMHEPGEVTMFALGRGTLRLTLAAHSDSVQSIAFSPDGRTLASGGGDKAVKLWQVTAAR